MVSDQASGGRAQLDGKVAVVTGAATGLGREIARLYAEAGAAVVVADVAAQEAHRTAELIVEAGGKALFVETDVTIPSQVQQLMATAESHFGGLHIMTANAGILGRGHGKAFTDLREEEFAQIMDVNFGGVRRCFAAAIPTIRRSGGGSMTATGSLSAHRGYANLAAYSASKGAVLALVRALAHELAPEIRVNAVSPGTIRTDMRRHAEEAGATPSAPSGAPPEPTFGGSADPRQVAWAHLFLVSDQASFINGQVLLADGGRSIVPA